MGIETRQPLSTQFADVELMVRDLPIPSRPTVLLLQSSLPLAEVPSSVEHVQAATAYAMRN